MRLVSRGYAPKGSRRLPQLVVTTFRTEGFPGMRTAHCAPRGPGVVAGHLAILGGAIPLRLLRNQPAHAIPSPELVVGSFVSISQLFALASAVLGGGAAYATMRARKRGASAEMSRGLLYTAVGLFAVLVISIGVNIWQYVTDSNARQARLE